MEIPLKRYMLAKRLLEIQIDLYKKFNIEEYVKKSIQVNSLEVSSSNKTVELPEELFYMQSNQLILDRLEKRFESKLLTKNDLDIAIESVKMGHLDNIGLITEEFWMQVFHENLSITRSSNRLLKILKKGYLSLIAIRRFSIMVL